MADYFSNLPNSNNNNSVPSWWNLPQGNATYGVQKTASADPNAGVTGTPGSAANPNLSGTTNQPYGNAMPSGGVAGGKVSANGQYWVNPDGTLAFMGNQYNPDAPVGWENVGKGDMYTGTRDGWIYANGNRLMPTFGDPTRDMAELTSQFGYNRPQDLATLGSQYNVDPNKLGMTNAGAGRWTGNNDMSDFRANSSNNWTGHYTDEQLRYQLSTITQEDYNRYSPDQQARIRAILGTSAPAWMGGGRGNLPVTSGQTVGTPPPANTTNTTTNTTTPPPGGSGNTMDPQAVAKTRGVGTPNTNVTTGNTPDPNAPPPNTNTVNPDNPLGLANSTLAYYQPYQNIANFRANSLNNWTDKYSDPQLREQLGTITQQDYNNYSPEQQARIRAILGDNAPTWMGSTGLAAQPLRETPPPTVHFPETPAKTPPPTTTSNTGAPKTTPVPGTPNTSGVSVDANNHLTYNGQPVTSANLYGTSGVNFSDFTTNGSPEQMAQWYAQGKLPSQYYEPYTVNNGDAGSFTSYRLKPDVAAKLNGRIQIGGPGVGGAGEVIDSSKVTYDPEFGFLTDPSNIKAPATSWNDYAIPAMLAIAGGGIAAEANGLIGSGATAGATTASGLPSVTVPGALNAADFTIPSATANLVSAPALTTGTSLISQIASGLRSGLSLTSAISRVLGGTTGRGNMNLGNLGNLNLSAILNGVVGTTMDNRNINDYNSQVNSLINRGDPYGSQRQAAIDRLNALEANPGSVTSNPLFSAMNDKSQTDLQRQMAARGLSVSGNELGALQNNFLANMNQFYNDEWNRTAREAGVFIDPSNMAGRGLTSAALAMEARNNRNAGVSNLLNGRNGGTGGLTLNDIINAGGTVWDWLGNFFNGSNSDNWSSVNDVGDLFGDFVS